MCETGKSETHQEAGFAVQVERYSPAGGSDRAVVILPPTGGATFLESRYARQFCRAGFDVFAVSRWSGMSDSSLDVSIHSTLFGRAQRAIGLLADRMDASFIGLLGTSVGGLHAATALGHVESVSAAFVIAAGAPVTEIIARTDQEGLRRLRERRMQHFGFESVEDYGEALAATFEWEPLDFLDAARSKPRGMILVEGDDTVPTAYQRRLQAAWQPQPAIVVGGFPVAAHPVGIFRAWWSHRDEILDFFLRHAHASG
jgi:hypothetical protein